MTATGVTRLRQELADRTGLDPDLLDRPALSGFVRRRCGQLGLPDESAYHELLVRDRDEMERLVQEVSVAETWFFRYPASFELLVDHAANLWRRRQDKLRMLSVACATGEEPYSMVMAAAAAGWSPQRVVMDATDRHEASLAIASEAVYGDNSFRETGPKWAEQWFTRGDAGVHVDARIAAAVHFSCQDILGAPSNLWRSAYDVVFCRNLFIYLNDAARVKLAGLLTSVISPDGVLFVGHAEQPILPSESFEPAGVGHAFACRPRRAEAPAEKDPVVARNAISKSRIHTSRTIAPRHVARASSANPRECVAPTLDDARAMANAGRLEDALAAINGLQGSQPTRPEVLELLGSIQLGLSHLEQARETFNKVLYFEPNHEQALLQIAIVSDRLGNAEQAARYRRRAARAHNEESLES